MGKNKLARWAEMKSFNNVIEPSVDEVFAKDHPLKGNWNRLIFKNENPVIIELGCGKGEYSVGLASRFSGNNYIGIDIKGARMWRGAKTAYENKLKNVAFLRTRIEFIKSFFSEDEVDEIWITFPDPQPKRRNAGKRLTSPLFLNPYRQFLKDKGIIHLKTDNKELWNYTIEVVRKNNLEIIISSGDLYSGEINTEILSIRTHYEKIFLKKAIKICYLAFRLDKNKILADVI
ncbi:MAG: tRNA (guanosine(46)-N7)-methyltransferase TrmB [Odoribacter sp.]|nr:tRNA (guanosine(46)-N7)-methyltransferase TrmB [Odoribacter sp.]